MASAASAGAAGTSAGSGGGTGTDRFNVNVSFSKNWEHLKTKFVGTGHPDQQRHDWVVQHHRDSISTAVGHADMLDFFAAGENEAPGRIRFSMLERLLQPCGPPPKLEAEEEERRLGIAPPA